MTGWIWYQEQTLLSFIVKKNILQNWLEIYSYLVLCRRAMNCLSSAIHLIHINAICCTFEGKEICAKIFKILYQELTNIFVRSVCRISFHITILMSIWRWKAAPYCFLFKEQSNKNSKWKKWLKGSRKQKFGTVV